jgi:FkbM family methyltransferase
MSIFNNQKIQKENEVFNITDDIELILPDGFSKFFNHYRDQTDLQHLEYENFIELTKGKKVLIDVGCHVGAFPLTFNSLEENRHSFGFDLNPLNMKAFLNILALNKDKRYDSITLYNILISDNISEKGFCILTGDSDFVKNEMGLQGVVDTDVDGLNEDWDFRDLREGIEKNSQKLTTETVDNFCDFLMTENRLLPDVIKIDVEGYEGKVLDGAQKTLRHIRPLMFIEIHQKYLPSYNSNIVDIYNHIKDLDYVMYDYNRKKVESTDQYESLFENLTELRVYCIHKSKKG